MKFKKTILESGDYYPLDPTTKKRIKFAAGPDRMRRWADQFRRMRSKGIKIPAAWGHQSQAKPIEADKREQQLAQFNAGYLTDLQYTREGKLVGEFDIPGAERDESGNVVTMAETPDGLKLKCAIGEVSASINDWTDGKSQKWADSLVHVALTPLPVYHGQDDFKPVADAAPVPGEVRLSLSMLFATGEAMPEEMKKEKKEGDKEPESKAEEKPPEEGDKPETPATDAQADAAEGTGCGELCSDVKEGLMALGIKLPDDFNPATLMEFLTGLKSAIVAHNHTKDHFGIDDGSKKPEGQGNEMAPPPQEESNYGVMMSLLTHEDPAVRLLASQQVKVMEANTASMRTDFEGRIDGYIKRGLKPGKARALKERCTQVNFSLASDGKPEISSLERELMLIDELLPRQDYTAADLSITAEEVPHPAEISAQEQQAMIDRLSGRHRIKKEEAKK